MYKGVNRVTSEAVAIKVMTKARLGERALNMLSAEINILRTLEHRESFSLPRVEKGCMISVRIYGDTSGKRERTLPSSRGRV